MSNKPVLASELTQKRSDSNVAYYYNSLELADPAGRIVSKRNSGTQSSDLINLQLARTTLNQTLSTFQSIYNIQPLPGLYRKNYRAAENSNAKTTYTSATAGTYTVPTTTNGLPVVGVNMYIWGGAGGFGNQPQGLGGGGGFVSGFFKCAGGTVLTYVIGTPGGPGAFGAGQGTILTGGGSGINSANYVWGGGFSAIFNCTTTAAAAQGNVIALAGGGGSSGQYSYGIGGGGGYPNGANTAAPAEGQSATGGSQTAGGTGLGGTASAMIGISGGGGGYYGGGGTTRGCGGGGSSYIGGLTSGAYWENGMTGSSTADIAYPGGRTNQYYTGNYGRATSNDFFTGLIVVVPCYEEWDGTYS